MLLVTRGLGRRHCQIDTASRHLGETTCGHPLCAYRGSSGPKNRPLIQPFKRPFSTCTQPASLLLTAKRVPFGAVATARAVIEGPDLMLTPGRWRKRISWF